MGKQDDNEKQITLNFRIQEQVVTVDKVNVNQPLSVAVQKALKDHPGRKVDEYVVTFNGKELDVSKKVGELGLSDGDTLKLTLKAGGGGE